MAARAENARRRNLRRDGWMLARARRIAVCLTTELSDSRRERPSPATKPPKQPMPVELKSGAAVRSSDFVRRRQHINTMPYDPNEPRDKRGQWTDDGTPADLRDAIAKEKTGSGPLTPSERVEMNELEITRQSRGHLGALNQARLDHLKSRS